MYYAIRRGTRSEHTRLIPLSTTASYSSTKSTHSSPAIEAELHRQFSRLLRRNFKEWRHLRVRINGVCSTYLSKTDQPCDHSRDGASNEHNLVLRQPKPYINRRNRSSLLNISDVLYPPRGDEGLEIPQTRLLERNWREEEGRNNYLRTALGTQCKSYAIASTGIQGNHSALSVGSRALQVDPSPDAGFHMRTIKRHPKLLHKHSKFVRSPYSVTTPTGAEKRPIYGIDRGPDSA